MNLKELLKNNNKSCTLERQMIFDIIKTIDHFDYSKLSNYLEVNNINIWRASLFRTLKLFLEINIIKVISYKDWITVYEYENEDHHHEHMKCSNCLKIIEFDDSEVHDSFIKLAQKHNFKLQSHSLVFEWLCSKCI